MRFIMKIRIGRLSEISQYNQLSLLELEKAQLSFLVRLFNPDLNQDFFVIWIRQLVLLIYISTMFGNWLKKCLISEIK